MLALVQFTHVMDFMIMMPMGPQLMRIFGISPKEFGFLVSAYTFAAGACGFVGAFFIDRFDRRAILLTLYVGFTLGTFACAIAPNYAFLLIARSLAGAFGGTLGALIFSVVGDAIPNEKRGRAMGVVMASFSLSSVFGVPFGIALSTRLSWHAPFVFVGLVATVNILMLALYMPSMRVHLASGAPSQSPVEVLKSIGRDSNQVSALLFTVFLMFSQFLLIPFFAPAMVSNVGFSEASLAWIYFVGGGLTIFTSPIVGRMADRFGRKRVFTTASLLLILPNIIVTHLGPTPIWLVLVLNAIWFVLGNARFVPSMAMVTSVVHPRTRGSFMSINSSLQSVASGSAALVAGLIVERAPDGRILYYGVLGWMTVTLGFVAIWLGRQLKPVGD